MTDNGPVGQMLEAYQCRNNDQRRSALKEIVQEITLVALSRNGFFNRGAFYGGTALRIFHGLGRFSEDLDFSLLEPDPAFDLGLWLEPVRQELASFGFDMEVSRKAKSAAGAVQSAFIKGGTLIHLVRIVGMSPPVSGVPAGEMLKIKFEVDTDPPAGATFEIKYRLLPIPYSVRLYDLPSLFAGKIHAVLCRNWNQRVKGRDFFDYLWLLGRGVSVNLPHLEARMRQSGHLIDAGPLDRDRLVVLLKDRFSRVDYEQARRDIAPYIADSRLVEAWSRDLFTTVTSEQLKCS
ncbi:MAG TPA: nucleotidyl transferase AbiEii/AbiGii toxin family protein [Myxococcota bacterium]|nr:nucleotidyl transferase AbiEii/AbiGii toxin family protein [Myxococcota bacterium]